MDDEERPKDRRYHTVNGKTVRVCPECGAALVARTNRATGEKFLGCTQYPTCLHTEKIPLDQQIRALGHPTLPGL